jgi:hypothetical protein
MISIGMIVTKCLTAKTHCHHNFGYGSRKHMIPRAQGPSNIGPRYALESKLVYSR